MAETYTDDVLTADIGNRSVIEHNITQSFQFPVRSSNFSHSTSQKARHRESRAAVNFAPPVLERLSEKYTRPRQIYYPRNHDPSNDALCATCAAIDLLALFRDGIACEACDGILVRRGIPVGWSDEIYARGKCPFCRLLVDLGDTRMSGGEREVEFWSLTTLKGYEVISSVAEPLYEVVDGDDDISEGDAPAQAVYLALVRTMKAPPGYGFEYRTVFKEITYLGLIDGEDLNADRSFNLQHTSDAAEIAQKARSWLERCESHEKCRARKAMFPDFPEGFRLFDIKSLRIIDSRGQEPFITLSYPRTQVEKIQIKEKSKSCTLEAFPKILQDLISFVRALDLGIHHIWMDQLCIDQDEKDSVQKQTNVNAMGTIYGAAFATVLLTMPFRGGPEKGLAGISAPRALYQREETVGKLRLATTYPSLDMTIVSSLWNTRGWTFEEGILSSRCITFGPEQVYFECNEMASCESMQVSGMATPERDHLIPYRSRLRNPFLRPYDFEELYWRLVREYTSRDLSHEKDALNAFSAFSSEFGRDGHKLVWGLPTVGIAQHLLWEHEPWDFREIRRRDNFPSWSWAGWSGKAAFNFPLDEVSRATRICTVTIEPQRGEILKCYARTASVGVEGQGPICAIIGALQSSIMMDRGMSAGPTALARNCILMEVCEIDGFAWGLIVEQKNGYFERIGVGYAKFSDSEAVRFEPQDIRIA